MDGRPASAMIQSIGIDDGNRRRKPRATREELERQTLDYVATMPAWQDHPRVTSGEG
jgi:hypothetical protein